ncbi:hypothetical protein QFZ91_000182 [Paraburkholderia sp. JPY419]
MPMIDALWPEDALTPEAEARLVKEPTDILISSRDAASLHARGHQRRHRAQIVTGVPA